MSIEFAEKIIDGMVDENGFCGERGMSEKQFDCIAPYLEAESCERVGEWNGSRGGRVKFYETIWAGKVGKYQVVLSEVDHFRRRCTVVEINLRPQAEIEAEEKRRELERELREIGRFEHSEWVGEPKKRMELELTLIRDYCYERPAYTYGTETAHIYTLADADGNCYVWKTTSWLDIDIEHEDGSIDYVQAEPGDKVTMKATVKEHGEYKGTKQTVITRPKVQAIEKRAA